MRLVTRGDLDGLTCAVLICLNEKIDRIILIHPQDITDDRVVIEEEDIIANLPYHPNCAKWFDHHLHTATATARPASTSSSANARSARPGSGLGPAKRNAPSTRPR